MQTTKTQIVKTPLAKLIRSRCFAGLCGGVLAVGFSISAHALEIGGRVVEWQHSGVIRTDLPAGSQHNVKAIASGFAYRLALRVDGTVTYWGLALPGAVLPDADALTDVKAVFAGGNNAYVIKSDGRVVGWGDNTFGQLDIPPAAASGVRTLSTSAGRVVAIKEDGTVFGWGNPLVNGSNAGHNAALATEIQPRLPVSVSISGLYDLFLCADQTVGFLGSLPAGSKPLLTNDTTVALGVEAGGGGCWPCCWRMTVGAMSRCVLSAGGYCSLPRATSSGFRRPPRLCSASATTARCRASTEFCPFVWITCWA